MVDALPEEGTTRGCGVGGQLCGFMLLQQGAFAAVHALADPHARASARPLGLDRRLPAGRPCDGDRIFRWYYEIFNGGGQGDINNGLAAQSVDGRVWGRAALLVGLFFAFLTARSTVDEGSELPHRVEEPRPALTG